MADGGASFLRLVVALVNGRRHNVGLVFGRKAPRRFYETNRRVSLSGDRQGRRLRALRFSWKLGPPKSTGLFLFYCDQARPLQGGGALRSARALRGCAAGSPCARDGLVLETV